MSSENLSKLQALQAKKNTNVEIDTEKSAAEAIIEDSISNANTQVVKVDGVNGELKNVDVSTGDEVSDVNAPADTNDETDETNADKKKSNRGRKPTRSETMTKFSYKVPKDLADTAKASLLRKGKKVQPIMTKLIENWIANPTELNIDQAYLDIPARQMKSTGFFMEQATINEFGAVATENDTSMNLVVIHLYNEIVRGNY